MGDFRWMPPGLENFPLSLILSIFVVIIIISLALYVIGAIGLYRINVRLGEPNPALSFVPIAQLYNTATAAWVSPYWALSVIPASFLPFGWLALMVLWSIAVYLTAKRLEETEGKTILFTILSIIGLTGVAYFVMSMKSDGTEVVKNNNNDTVILNPYLDKEKEQVQNKGDGSTILK